MNKIIKSYSRRKVFSFLSGFFIALCSKSAIAEFKAGQPFRDRFQTYRQTFRIEPDPEEAQRIVKNIIKGREIRDNLINLKPALQDGFLANAIRRNKEYKYDIRGGYHCIAAGMHYGPTDVVSILKNNKVKDINYWKSEWKNVVSNLDNKKNTWKKEALNNKKLLDFL